MMLNEIKNQLSKTMDDNQETNHYSKLIVTAAGAFLLGRIMGFIKKK
ncbi:hypothetical protein Halha_1381 [Halobacteroides halobius DSM 5150]|uniref:Uncharacterized protein n=1 Tax=Halobacteroides halobius (strain ATCC 35273 / DSM 5150 / MD-1) TaxID=748449 RepID=L0K8K3_HALHC|nr:hypothetical protein [Halobacteroides halobius]AGB41326.1 hypothetical protein Halha_1381 [Halobacteroides halobius DSM 5150]